MSQLELALEAEVSARHLSFLETGRSRPSAEMVLQLAETLDVPLRERNGLLLAAGYAPAYGQRDLADTRDEPVREAIDRVLQGHEPFPAVVVDRHWGLVAANRSMPLLPAGVAPHLLEPPVNVLRVSLHPEGSPPGSSTWPSGGRICSTGLAARPWRAATLRCRPSTTSWQLPARRARACAGPRRGGIAVPLRLELGRRRLAFISTATTFGTAVDITVSELSIEAFFPADDATSEFVRSWAARA